MEKFLALGMALFAALPATTNYQLNSYGFGSGGTAGSSTATYSLEGTSGEFSGQTGSTTNYSAKPGFVQTQQANVPKVSSIDTNGGLYYNRLHFVIDPQGNPSDATFLVAVSSDGFSTDTKYLQTDGTLSASLLLADYQTYAAFGSSGGSLITGLLPATTYTIKIKATQGKHSESAFGPTSALPTAAQTITFNLVTSNQSVPPFSVDLGSLTSGAISTTAQTINTSFSTNAASGGDVYINGQNSGLLSSSTGYKINAVSTDLTGVGEGFGAQNSSITQTSGGPFSVVSPYSVTGTNVGIVDTTTRSLYSATAPVTGGAGVLLLKAKSASTDIAASDYQEVLTFTAAANF